MPSPQTILAQLAAIANGAMALAITWHVITAAALIALALGWRPSYRRAGALLAAPIASASIVAFAFGNPFNGVILGVLALSLLGLASRLGPGTVERSSRLWSVAGAMMIGFGWLYPHFLPSRSPATYLFAAPTGLIPCPTLSLVVGFALLAGGLRSRAWSSTLALVGLFYGLFGFARLAVRLDVVLVGGAAALLVAALVARGSTNRMHVFARHGEEP